MTSQDQLWHLPTSELVLPSGEVHVWRVPLEQPESQICRLAQVLSPQELSRAERFYFERDRRRFVVSHGALRTVLGQYMKVEPNQIQFRHSPHGKPYLLEPLGGQHPLQFSLTHSHELALLALALGREVGVDLEYVRPLPDAEQIAAQCFSVQENLALQAVPEKQRLEAFFNYWTRKEAYVKATGAGLAQALDQCRSGSMPGELSGLRHADERPETVAEWCLEPLVPAAGYVATIARAPGWRVRFWEYPHAGQVP